MVVRNVIFRFLFHTQEFLKPHNFLMTQLLYQKLDGKIDKLTQKLIAGWLGLETLHVKVVGCPTTGKL